MAVRLIGVYCSKCQSKLYQYRKGGKGSLVKCFLHKINTDYTIERGICPKCHSMFARKAVIRNKKANKILGGKVFTRKR
jgi:hypothetical protein